MGQLARRPDSDPARCSIIESGSLSLRLPSGLRKRGRPRRPRGQMEASVLHLLLADFLGPRPVRIPGPPRSAAAVAGHGRPGRIRGSARALLASAELSMRRPRARDGPALARDVGGQRAAALADLQGEDTSLQFSPGRSPSICSNPV
eukprot:562542-Pyramimonas_sp.AAC.1